MRLSIIIVDALIRANAKCLLRIVYGQLTVTSDVKLRPKAPHFLIFPSQPAHLDNIYDSKLQLLV